MRFFKNLNNTNNFLISQRNKVATLVLLNLLNLTVEKFISDQSKKLTGKTENSDPVENIFLILSIYCSLVLAHKFFVNLNINTSVSLAAEVAKETKKNGMSELLGLDLKPDKKHHETIKYLETFAQSQAEMLSSSIRFIPEIIPFLNIIFTSKNTIETSFIMAAFIVLQSFSRKYTTAISNASIHSKIQTADCMQSLREIAENHKDQQIPVLSIEKALQKETSAALGLSRAKYNFRNYDAAVNTALTASISCWLAYQGSQTSEIMQVIFQLNKTYNFGLAFRVLSSSTSSYYLAKEKYSNALSENFIVASSSPNAG